jgi:2OG-Fe(II) oxygenase superfamily
LHRAVEDSAVLSYGVDARADPRRFRQHGFVVVDGFLGDGDCARLLRRVGAYRDGRSLPLIRRNFPGRALEYMVIDGRAIARHLPELVRLYDTTADFARRTAAMDLAPLDNAAATVNVNLTPPGGEYRWHYDRNAVTAILYLNRVEGGETEMVPDFRLHLGRFKHTALQRRLDRWVQLRWVRRLARRREIRVAPCPGRLLLMRGDRCLHSVRPVGGETDRVNVVMAFDRPGARFAVEEDLDPYLYDSGSDPDFDPNYRR